MKEAGEGSNPSPEEMTRDMMAKYRDATNGQLDIHVFAHQGVAQQGFITAHGQDLSEKEVAFGKEGRGEEGEQVELQYVGLMSPEECKQLADNLEAQLSAVQ